MAAALWTTMLAVCAVASSGIAQQKTTYDPAVNECLLEYEGQKVPRLMKVYGKDESGKDDVFKFGDVDPKYLTEEAKTVIEEINGLDKKRQEHVYKKMQKECSGQSGFASGCFWVDGTLYNEGQQVSCCRERYAVVKEHKEGGGFFKNPTITHSLELLPNREEDWFCGALDVLTSDGKPGKYKFKSVLN